MDMYVNVSFISANNILGNCLGSCFGTATNMNILLLHIMLHLFPIFLFRVNVDSVASENVMP